MPHRRTPGQRAGLTHQRVLDAARRLLAERGLDGLTMRGLAGRLEVAPNALYSHVPSKTALLDELLDTRLADVAEPTAVDPVDGLHQIMTDTYRVLLAHADLVPFYLARQGARGPHAHRLGELMAERLATLGRTGEQAREAVRVLVIYTIGFAAYCTGTPGEAGADLDADLDADELAGNFDHGLRWLLAGIGSPGAPRSAA